MASLLRLARSAPAALLACWCGNCERPYGSTAFSAYKSPRCPFCGAGELLQRRWPEDPTVLG